MPDEVQDDIEDAAQKPRRMRGDEGEIEEHSLPDQIEADRYLSAREAVKKQHRGLRFSVIQHPGTT